MRRLPPFIGLLAAIGLLLASLAPAAASSPIDDYARVIESRHGGATFVQVDGCHQTEVFISAMDATFGSRPGPVNQQGLVGVFYRQLDICGEPGPKGYPVLYTADARSLDQLVSPSAFDSATVAAVLSGTDGDGEPVEIGIDIAWSATEEFDRSRVRGNGTFSEPGEHGARVHTFSHNSSAPATAAGFVTIDGTRLELGPTEDATLEQVRYFCQVIQHPRGGFDVDC